MSRAHLRVLGLEESGSSLNESVLKKAYFCRALACHPDKPGGTKEQFHLEETCAKVEYVGGYEASAGAPGVLCVCVSVCVCVASQSGVLAYICIYTLAYILMYT